MCWAQQGLSYFKFQADCRSSISFSLWVFFCPLSIVFLTWNPIQFIQCSDCNRSPSIQLKSFTSSFPWCFRGNNYNIDGHYCLLDWNIGCAYAATLHAWYSCTCVLRWTGKREWEREIECICRRLLEITTGKHIVLDSDTDVSASFQLWCIHTCVVHRLMTTTMLLHKLRALPWRLYPPRNTGE